MACHTSQKCGEHMKTVVRKSFYSFIFLASTCNIHADSSCNRILGDWKETKIDGDEKIKINDCVTDFLAQGKYFLKISAVKGEMRLYIDTGVDLYPLLYEQCTKKNKQYLLRNKVATLRRPLRTIVTMSARDKDREKICLNMVKNEMGEDEIHCFVRLSSEEEKCRIDESVLEQ